MFGGTPAIPPDGSRELSKESFVMSHNRVRARLWAALVALLVVLLSWGSADVAAADTSPAWTGTFDNFHTSSWNSSWGLTSDTAQCAIAVGTYNCNWGYDNLQAVTDSTSPNGQALKVTYPAKSGPPSCFKGTPGCVLGGGQFYQDLTTNGQTALHNSQTIDLKYYYNFPVGFDFGGKTAGKMPGLYGGVPGCESGGQHCANGWSTRYMWRGGSKTAPDGELYFYGGSGSGYGQDICLGNWTFPADGTWHSIEQLVDISTGAVTIWSDGKSVCTTKQTFASPVSGVFFSTFHGGHDLSWSPTKTTTAEFADFTLATDGPQGGTGTGGSATVTIKKTKGSGKTYTDTATITNSGSTAINGWNVQFDLDSTMKISKVTKVTITSSANHYTLTNTSADATIPVGAKVSFTFSGSFTKSYVAPTNVTFTATG
jgi:hypothetical protein